MSNLNKFTIQKSFAVNAGAGSGKTYILSRRYINAILGFDLFTEDPKQDRGLDKKKYNEIRDILTLTFTEAAASEMKERIFGLIKKILTLLNTNFEDKEIIGMKTVIEGFDTDLKEHIKDSLQKAMEQSSEANISTIHSYCTDLIRSNADIVKMDGEFNIIVDHDKERIIDKVIFETMNKQENKDKVIKLANTLNIKLLDNLIKKYINTAKFRDGFNVFNKESINTELYKELIRDLYPLKEYKGAHKNEPALKAFNNFTESLERFEGKSEKEFLEKYELNSFRRPKTIDKIEWEEIKELREINKNYISAYSLIDEEKEKTFFNNIDLLKNILNEIRDNYIDRIIENNELDFDSIIETAIKIIHKVNTGFKYIMVDEFQDTNSKQYDIIKGSMGKDTNLFVVGDSKQSIYSFQGAEIEVFNEAVRNRKLIEEVVPMSNNHRSDGLVLDNINKIFEEIFRSGNKFNKIKQNYEAEPQALKVFNSTRKDMGSFKLLISSNDKNSKTEMEDINEYENIAKFIGNIKSGKIYPHIKKLIDQKKRAIAVLFDSKAKMLELKDFLDNLGIESKVSNSENFYYSKEVNDIFNLLKAIQILQADKVNYNSNEKYYIAGALRSNILRYSDNEVKQYLDNNSIPDDLIELVELSKKIILSELVKNIYEIYSLETIYSYMDNASQRIMNIQKFLTDLIEYEKLNGDDFKEYLDRIENNIYFSENKEESAFYKNENVESLELCTIHSTKGLAYPMVILANSNKSLFKQVTTDTIKSNDITFSDGDFTSADRIEIAGFKLGNYEPISLRVLKAIDKLKHLAEKKRLFYVALTRAEHDVVISGMLTRSKNGNISLGDDSYLSMVVDGLKLNKEELFEQSDDICIKGLEEIKPTPKYIEIKNEDIKLKELHFTNRTPISATMESDDKTIITKNKKAADIGTLTHRLIELFWDKLEDGKYHNYFEKFEIYDKEEQEKITVYLNTFKESEVYRLLRSGVKHYFEFEFSKDDKRGFIDLLYFNEEKNGWKIIDFKTGKKTIEKEEKYQEQLSFYRGVLEGESVNIVGAELLWLEE